MKLEKTYALVRYLNRHHSKLSCVCFAIAAFLSGVLFSRSLIIAKYLSRSFYNDDFYTGLRRGAWFARCAFPVFSWLEDPYFNFALNTTEQERKALKAFLLSRVQSDSIVSDVLYVEAESLHQRLLFNEQTLIGAAEVEEFYDHCDKYLDQVFSQRGEKINSTSKREGDFSSAEARKALAELSDLLPLNQWNWFVISGTFLGLHRESGFLEHDYDIDVGLMAESCDVESLLPILESSGKFQLKKLDWHLNIYREEEFFKLDRKFAIIKLVHKNGLSIDIFLHYKEGSTIWHGSSIHKWVNANFGLVSRELGGVEVLAPDNPDVYLRENYGEWRVPVKDFNCSTGTPNLTISKNFSAIALFLKKIGQLRKIDEEKSLLDMLCSDGVLVSEGRIRVNREFI